MITHKHEYFTRTSTDVYSNVLCGKSFKLPVEYGEDIDYGGEVMGVKVFWFDDEDVTCEDCMAQYALMLLGDLP